MSQCGWGAIACCHRAAGHSLAPPSPLPTWSWTCHESPAPSSASHVPTPPPPCGKAAALARHSELVGCTGGEKAVAAPASPPLIHLLCTPAAAIVLLEHFVVVAFHQMAEDLHAAGDFCSKPRLNLRASGPAAHRRRQRSDDRHAVSQPRLDPAIPGHGDSIDKSISPASHLLVFGVRYDCICLRRRQWELDGGGDHEVRAPPALLRHRDQCTGACVAAVFEALLASAGGAHCWRRRRVSVALLRWQLGGASVVSNLWRHRSVALN